MDLGNILVIHPNDETTKYLNRLYSGIENCVVIDESYSDDEVVKYLTSNDFDTVMMLGHGCDCGLFAPQEVHGKVRQFGRLIISDEHAELLRNKRCIGIWCNANQFALKHGILSGLFSGMVISELYEAEMCFVSVSTQIEMNEHNEFWASSLRDCIDRFNLRDVPNKMSTYINEREMTNLEAFNFNSLYCFINGIEQDDLTNDDICKIFNIDDIGEFSDGYHTFNSLYHQRLVLFAALVKAYKDKSWKSLRHEDGEECFGGGWFIVGIDTPEGSYTYHYEIKDWDLFDCKVLDRAKHWDGHTDKDVMRLMSL